MSLKPIKIHAHTSAGPPNPWKVVIVCEDLGVPYEWTWHSLGALKQPDFEQLNPNGRVPVMEDPNTNVVLWESGAIVEYLVWKYDTEGRLKPDGDIDHFKAQQWLHFQMSGQGPYYGQFVWFSHSHAEKLPSAIKRYSDEFHRILGVLDRHFKASGSKYLLGDKATYADIAFAPWHWAFEFLSPGIEGEIKATLPSFWAWHERVNERPSVKRSRELRGKMMAQGNQA